MQLGIQYHLCTLFTEEQSHLSVVSLGTRKCKLIWMSQCNSLSQTTLVFVYDCNHDLTSLSPCSEVGNGNSLQYSCLENYMDGEAWQGTVHGVPKNQIQLPLTERQAILALILLALFHRVVCTDTIYYKLPLGLFWFSHEKILCIYFYFHTA